MATQVTPQERRMIFSLRDDGQSERSIARSVGYAPSTVHAVLTEPPPEAVESNGHSEVDVESNAGEVIAGQQTIDGGEVPAVVPDPPLEQIRVDGTTQLGFFDAGGKQPQAASLRLSGGKIELVDGRAFKKGDVIHFEGTAVVREVAIRDKPDPATGIVVSAEQKHTAQIVDLQVSS